MFLLLTAALYGGVFEYILLMYVHVHCFRQLQRVDKWEAWNIRINF